MKVKINFFSSLQKHNHSGPELSMLGDCVKARKGQKVPKSQQSHYVVLIKPGLTTPVSFYSSFTFQKISLSVTHIHV